MKNILVLTNIYPAPDIEKVNTPVVHYFTREWVKMGYNVRVINYPANFPKILMWGAAVFKNQLSSKLGATIRTYQVSEREYELEKVIIKRIPLLKRKLHGAYSKSELNTAYNKTINYLQSQHFYPDVIVSHWVNPQLEIMDRLKQVYKCKTCYVAHLAFAEFEKIYTREQSQRLINNIDIVGFRSPCIRDAFMQQFNYNRPFFLCYSGIPEKYIPQIPIVRTFDSILNFIYVGTLIKRKYPAEIILALVKVFNNHNFSMSYIGKGAESKRIEYYAKKFRVKDNIHLLGYITRDEVVKQFQMNDVFIMISRNEAFGLVYLEAMAQGLIVIASKNEGFDGIIHHGKNGFLCESGNVEELSQLIAVIKKMPSSQLQEISVNAIETARNLTDSKAAKLYIDAVIHK